MTDIEISVVANKAVVVGIGFREDIVAAVTDQILVVILLIRFLILVFILLFLLFSGLVGTALLVLDIRMWPQKHSDQSAESPIA